MNLLLTNMFNNVRAYDRDKKVVVDIAEINNLKTLVREKREVNAYGQKFEFATRTIVKTHPQYLYKRNDQEIWVKKNLGDRTVRFVIDDRVTAMAVPEGIAPPKSSHVTFHIDGPDLDICEAASLYFVFSLKN